MQFLRQNSTLAAPEYTRITALAHQLHQDEIEQQRLRIEFLFNENQTLKSQMTKLKSETNEIVDYCRREVALKDDKIRSLKKELSTKEENFNSTITNMRITIEMERTIVQETKTKEEKRLNDEIISLKEDLADLEKYVENRNAYNRQLHELSSKLEAQEQQHKDKLVDAERSYLLDKSNIQKEITNRWENVVKQAQKEALRNLNEKCKRMLVQNLHLSKELEFHRNISNELQKNCQSLTAHVSRLKRETEMLRMQDLERAQQSCYKVNEIQDLRSEITSLQQDKKKVEIGVLQERIGHRFAMKREAQEQMEDSSNLHKLINLKNKELKHVCSFAQYILDQRSEVERFLLEALQEVKKYKEEERKPLKNSRTVNTGNLVLPVLRTVCTETHAIDSDPHVELHDLNWSERDRVLHLLFAKINYINCSNLKL